MTRFVCSAMTEIMSVAASNSQELSRGVVSQ